MQKSYRAPDPGEKRQWFLIDAKDQVLGRLAVVIANKLRAKDLPTYDPSVDAGAFVIVINAKDVKLIGNRAELKDDQRYSGWRDGLKHIPDRNSTRLNSTHQIISYAVFRLKK